MSEPPTDPGLVAPDYLDLAARAARPPNQSSLYRWLEQMFDSLGPGTSRMADWRPICEAALAAGVVGGKGQLPTPRLLADQWRKIKRRRRATAQSVHDAASRHSSAMTPPAAPNTDIDPVFKLASTTPRMARPAEPETLTEQEKDRRAQEEIERAIGKMMSTQDRRESSPY